jgi:Tfp pilus assembly protein FimT
VSNVKAPVTSLALVAVVLALAGCNTPSMEDIQRLESELAKLHARVQAAEVRANRSTISADSALDSAGQCVQTCQQVSDRLDQLYLENTRR